MTSFRRRVVLGTAVASVAALAQMGAWASVKPAPATKRVNAVAARRIAVRTRAAAPAILRDQIAALGRNFDGKAGIAGKIPSTTVSVMTGSARVSNAKFKAATGWAPAVPSQREGWPLILEEMDR